ncbi:MAG TPA: helix-turn-helix transcriptional regulator [bacterium]|nr:helix-turn-helix transcriptional regulator [bacterium]
MNPIYLLRSQTGVTQQALAARAGTSQPTIALYESGAKSPTIATLGRLASSLGLELVVAYAPRMTREDQRSLTYHGAVAEVLRRDPVSAVRRAKRSLGKMSKDHPGAKPLFDRWSVWLDLPLQELISRMLDPGMTAREMRQVTPFAGLLAPQDRVRILKRFRKEYGA